MNYFFITGVSRGIGKSLVEELLKSEDNYVVGLGRTSVIEHERYEFIKIDLSVPAMVMKYQFINIIDAESITLINNSGMLGYVDVVGKVENQSIIDTFNLNSIAPAILMNNFASAYQGFKGQKLVLNISSGAGRHTVDSWSSYCATKAALDMFTSVANQEQKNNFSENPVHFLSVAPGIVDTKMQDEIRAIDEDRFSDVSRFVNYKKDNQLSSSDEVAQKLIRVIEKSADFKTAMLDIREIAL
jgi:benzil reductase ((S)-benzoin forming)